MLIVIEGLDGSGKATQSRLLLERLLTAQKPAVKISFPDYESESSALVRLYLSGELGEAGDVNAYAASGFYAADRYVSYTTKWRKDYESGKIIVADRYATSNVCHQMPKLPFGEWDAYLSWLEDSEYVKLGLPRPDAVVYLDMPPEISRVLIENRRGKENPAADIHERDLEYLNACRKAALYAAEKQGWRVLRCYEGDGPLPVETVADMIDKVLDL